VAKNKLGLRLVLPKGLYSNKNISQEELDPEGAGSKHILSGLIPQGGQSPFPIEMKYEPVQFT